MSNDQPPSGGAHQQDTHHCGAEHADHSEKALAWQLIQMFRGFRRHNFSDHSWSGYRHSDLMLLVMIKRNCPPDSAGMRVSDIVSRLRVKAPTVTQQIKPLEADGLVERASDPTDRRVALIRLTDKGEQLARQFECSVIEWVGGLVRHLGEDDSKQLIELLSRVILYFKSKQEQD